MRAELGTIVAVRRTAVARGSLGTAGGDEALSARMPTSPDDVDLVVFATPSHALDAVEDLIEDQPSLAVGVHVGELADDPRLNEPIADLVTSLARRARPGQVLVTDVVVQLAAGSGRSFSPQGHIPVAGRLTRLHALAPHVPASTRPTFGRGLELASLEWLVDELLAGSGRTVVLEGEPGIGKSHLATEAQRRAESMGVRVARATADELGRDRPGHLAASLLTALVLDRPGDADVADAGGRGDHRFIDHFTDTVEAVAQEQPVLLVAEDLHWADDLSLRAIGALVPRLAPVSAGVVASLRPTPRPDMLTKLDDVFDAAGAEHHVLDPLDAEAVTSLVAIISGAAPGPRLRDRLLTTAGNPLFVIEMMDALHHAGALDVAAGVVDVEGDDVELPEALRTTVLRRMRGLPDRTVELLRRASLLGSTSDLVALSAVTDETAMQVADAIAPAIDAGVLARQDNTVQFRHDVIREAVLAELPPAVRREMHTAAGTALARAGASPVTVARQFALGASAGDTRPVEWLRRAADDVRALDPAATVALSEEALALAPEGWEGAVQIRTSMIEPLTACGRVDEAIERARSLLSTPLEPTARERVTNGLVAALATRGHLLEAADVAVEAAARPDVDPYRARLFECIATSMRIFVDGSSEEARRGARAALDARTGVAPVDDELACWARNALGLAALADGSYEEARAEFDASRQVLDRTDITDHGFLIPHLNVSTAAAYLDDFDTFEAHRRALMERSSSRGEPAMLMIGHFGGAAVAFMSGRWDDALSEVEAGLSLGSETGVGSMTVGLHALSALVHTGRGRPGEADDHLESGFEALARGAHLFGVDLLVLARARRLEEAGADEEARQLVLGFWDQAGHIALALQYRDLLPHVVRLGEPALGDRRAKILETVDRARRNTPVPSTIASAARCRGLATGDAELVTEAVELLRASPRSIERAEACEEAAALCFADGRGEDAARFVDEAVTIWDDAGAVSHIARLDALARANGVRRRRSRPAGATHGWASLSPKELEVVELVAEGLSNPVIGERLYISRRTVESHLSHVFTKLGLSNRAQLAAAVVERRSGSQDP